MKSIIVDDKIVECPSCGNNKLKYYSENIVLKLPIYTCPKCLLHITGKSFEEFDMTIENYYNKSFWDESRNQGYFQNDFTDNHSKGRYRNWLSQYKYCKRYLDHTKSILEMGSGRGEALLSFEAKGFDVTGLEPDEENTSIINKKLIHGRCINGLYENTKIEKKFDMIWLSHVFEHISKPIEFLKNVKKNLNHFGNIFIEVPSVEMLNDYRTFTKTPHAYNFSKQALINMIHKAGYNVLSCDYFRPAEKHEGVINKIKSYPYYSRIKTDSQHGQDIRIIITPN